MIKIISNNLSLQNIDCEGNRCNSNTSHQLKLTVQNIGTITLLLCEKCLLQFLKDGDKAT